MRYCAVPGCPAIVESGRCATHAKKADRARGTARQRGYTSAWDRASAAYLLKHPWCAMCGQPAEVTDHIKAPKLRQATTAEDQREASRLFWDPANWQALCQRCNKRKAIEREGGFGR
jgi:5-methylcytosine-specific restriction protein A